MSMLHITIECDCDRTALLRNAIKHAIPIYAEVIECDASILTNIDWKNWDKDSLAHVPAGRQYNGKCVQDFTRLSKAELQTLLRDNTLNIEMLGKQDAPPT